MIKVLIVDDSLVAQEFLAHTLSSDPAIRVVGFASDGAEALAGVLEMRPDVVTMDIHMRNVDGFEATRLIMETAPTPIVIVSASTSVKEVASTFHALDAGALAVVLLPHGIGQPEHSSEVLELIQTVKTMSEIKVVRRHADLSRRRVPAAAAIASVRTSLEGIQLIAIGASTGGPAALHKILSLLPQSLPVPILIVQHIASGFLEGFVEWLSDASHFPVHVATQGLPAEPGHAYVAPDDLHMGIGNGMRITLSKNAPDNGLRPSVAYLFRSVAQELGPHAIGVLLTGMGRDGAEGLKMLREKGALTIAQDMASSVVHGMPGEAIKIGAAEHILPPDAIGTMLANVSRKANGS